MMQPEMGPKVLLCRHFWESRLTLVCVNGNARHGPPSSHLRCWDLKGGRRRPAHTRKWRWEEAGWGATHWLQKAVGFNFFHLDPCKWLLHVSNQFLFPFTPSCHLLSFYNSSFPNLKFSNPLMLKRFPKPIVKFKRWVWYSEPLVICPVSFPLLPVLWVSPWTFSGPLLKLFTT